MSKKTFGFSCGTVLNSMELINLINIAPSINLRNGYCLSLPVFASYIFENFVFLCSFSSLFRGFTYNDTHKDETYESCSKNSFEDIINTIDIFESEYYFCHHEHEIAFWPNILTLTLECAISTRYLPIKMEETTV